MLLPKIPDRAPAVLASGRNITATAGPAVGGIGNDEDMLPEHIDAEQLELVRVPPSGGYA
jgi:hypothetical protein